MYVQFRHGRGLCYFGLSFSLKDILSSVGLFISIIIVASVIFALIPTSAFTRHAAESVSSGNSSVDFASRVVLLTISAGLSVVNQVLIGCVYLVSEVAALTRSKLLGVFACGILAAVLFLPAGLYISFVMTAIFLGFASYYAVARRATPLVLCYTYFVGLGLIIGLKR